MCNENLESEYLKYGVELFKYHADQRLRCIRYYTIILIACVVGVFEGARILLDKKNDIFNELSLTIILFGLCLGTGITLLFWLLDIRNRVLTEYAEDGLKRAEKYFTDQGLKIITNNEDRYNMAWHYGRIFPAFFSVTIVISIVIAIGFSFHLKLFTFTSCWYLIFSIIFIGFLLLFLGIGAFAEVKFCVKKKWKKEDSKSN